MTDEFHTNWLTPRGLELVRKYPLIFTEKDIWVVSYLGEADYVKRATENTYVNLRFGFEFNDGWLDLVEEFAKKATEIVLKERELGHPSFIHTGIYKEKWGELQNQGSNKLFTVEGIKEFNELDNYIEEQSIKTCELCGMPGMLIRGSWLKVRCGTCT